MKTLLKSRIGLAQLAVIAMLAHAESAVITTTTANGAFALTLPTTGIGRFFPMAKGGLHESMEIRDLNGGLIAYWQQLHFQVLELAQEHFL